MNHLRFMEKLLDGVEVEWMTLGEVATVTIGEFVHKNKQDPAAQYPVFNGGISNTGYYDKYNNTGDKIIVSARGANAGFVNRISKPYWAGNSCYSIGVQNAEKLNWSFIYYLLKNSENKLIGGQQKGGIPAVSKKQMEAFEIPVPCPENPKKSLEIQAEIVRILDTFTELTAELTTELTNRKKQFNYYSDQLLSFEEGEVEWKALGEVANIKNGKDWKKLGAGDIPVYGSGGVMKYVDTFTYDKPTVLIPRKGSITNIFYVESPFWNVDTIYYTEIDTDQIIPKFFYYFMKTIDMMQLDTGSGRPSLTQAILNQIKVPLPTLTEQARIVTILDKFDTLTTSITEGLPREIALRQQQYEYYRDLLLSFPKTESEVAA